MNPSESRDFRLTTDEIRRIAHALQHWGSELDRWSKQMNSSSNSFDRDVAKSNETEARIVWGLAYRFTEELGQ